jgi:hypothetical protein
VARGWPARRGEETGLKGLPIPILTFWVAMPATLIDLAPLVIPGHRGSCPGSIREVGRFNHYDRIRRAALAFFRDQGLPAVNDTAGSPQSRRRALSGWPDC